MVYIKKEYHQQQRLLFLIVLRSDLQKYALAAIEAAAGEEAGDLRHGDAVDLLMKDVIQPLLKIGNLVRQAYDQALGDLPQKDAGLGRRVQKLGAGVPKQLLRQQVQHGVGDLGRGEHLVVAQVGQAGEDVRIVVGGIEVRHGS